MPLVALAIVFVLVPLLELYLIFQVAELLGGGTRGALLTVAILAIDSLVGATLLKTQGRAVWRRFHETLGAGAMPHREVVDGVLVIFGGAFLITPGFLTDVVGIVFLLPPTRALVRRSLMRRLSRRVSGEFAVRRRGHADVEGTAHEHDVPTPRLER